LGVALVLALSVSACAIRAPYKEPTVAPATLRNADASVVVEQPFDPRWWGQFEDPVLDELESRALAANHDVRIAVARVDQARAIFDDVRLDRYPTVIAGASYDKRSQATPGFSDAPRTINTYSTGFDAFWELDVFGRIRNQVRSAAATADSFAAAVDDVRVSVAAEVARNYFELRGLQQRLEVAERSLANQQETLRLTRVRRDAGLGEEQDVASAGRTCRGDRIQHPTAARRDRAPRASSGGARRHTARRAWCRSGAACVSNPRESAANRRTELAATPTA
jgi:multidrug efflux system outer membrane protein